MNLAVRQSFLELLDAVVGDPSAAEVQGLELLHPLEVFQPRNGDGIDDLLIGAPYANPNGQWSGRAYLVYGQSAVLLGDAYGDKMVTDIDASILATHWQQQEGATWSDGDFNGDGKVTDADAAILATHWQEGVEDSVPVPEPSMPIALLSMAVVGLLAYSWQRRKRAA